MIKKSPLNRGIFSSIRNLIGGRFRGNKMRGSQGGVMAKLNQISSQISNIQGGTAGAAVAAPTPVSGTAGEANSTDPGSVDDVSQTMIDPTQVEESMLGDNEIPTKNQPALMMIKKIARRK